ncbi:MAG: sulfite exporter TauE/SafE family protein [Agitococcus sp.]|nr:sulfite exporter TauE/SafE family protein [Agitococcus sp.]
MTDFLIIGTALAAGFFGSPHCLGMCGGIVSALSFALSSQTPQRRFMLQTLYHLGRLISYSFLGLLVGLLGQGLLAPLANSKWPYIATAVMMIAFGLYLTGWWRGLDKLEALGGRLWQKMSPLRQRFMPINSPPRALIAGMLWGFLPCGLVYSALALALTSANAVTSSMAMLAFGLGTLPMMLLAGSTAGALKQKLQQHGWRTANGLLVIAFGVWTLLQAMMHSSGGHHNHASHQHPISPSTTTTPSSNTVPEHHHVEGMDMSNMPAQEMTTMPKHEHHHP